MSDADL